MKLTMKQFYVRALREQREWIDEHGATLVGYVERYGSMSDQKHYGNGGEAIYAADRAELKRLEDRVNR